MVACVAGVRKGRGRELGRETTRSRAPKLPLPLLLLTPATQATVVHNKKPHLKTPCRKIIIIFLVITCFSLDFLNKLKVNWFCPAESLFT